MAGSKTSLIFFKRSDFFGSEPTAHEMHSLLLQTNVPKSARGRKSPKKCSRMASTLCFLLLFSLLIFLGSTCVFTQQDIPD